MKMQIEIGQSLLVDLVFVMLKTRQRRTTSRTDLLDLAIFADVSAHTAFDVTSHIASLSVVNDTNDTLVTIII